MKRFNVFIKLLTSFLIVMSFTGESSFAQGLQIINPPAIGKNLDAVTTELIFSGDEARDLIKSIPNAEIQKKTFSDTIQVKIIIGTHVLCIERTPLTEKSEMCWISLNQKGEAVPSKTNVADFIKVQELDKKP